MSYDNPRRSTYYFDDVNFGGDSNVTSIIAVALSGRDTDNPGVGRRGRVRGVTIFNITEDFTGDASDAGVLVGAAGDTDAYFETGLVLDEDVDVGESVYLLDDGDAVDIPQGETLMTVTFIAGATTETGIASVALDIDWF